MLISEAHQQLKEQLSPLMGSREAASVARIVMEDVWGWHSGKRDRDFLPSEVEQLAAITKRLTAGEPVQYITRVADFYGKTFVVSPDVLIPRPETEELVRWVLSYQSKIPSARILDIGTGSGCIPVMLKYHWPDAEVHALDVCSDALAVATHNAERLRTPIHFHLADILAEATTNDLPSFDIIVSNPPYIPESEIALMPSQVLEHEPHLALFVPDADPLLFYRRILQWAKGHLNAGGRVFFECNEFNASQIATLAPAFGFQSGTLQQDMQGKDRMWMGKLV
ncbi:MAG: peptide chain release factor N(5)-glutamine methyltransferase [Saprospiraceae bacterium]